MNCQILEKLLKVSSIFQIYVFFITNVIFENLIFRKSGSQKISAYGNFEKMEIFTIKNQNFQITLKSTYKTLSENLLFLASDFVEIAYLSNLKTEIIDTL